MGWHLVLRAEERVSVLHPSIDKLLLFEGSLRRMIISRTKKIQGSARVRSRLNVASSDCFRSTCSAVAR